MTEFNKSSNPQNSPEAGKWRIEGNLFDEAPVEYAEKPAPAAEPKRSMAGTAVMGAGVEKPVWASADRNPAGSADAYLAQEAARRNLFGQTDEQLAYQAGQPRSASRPARQARSGRPVPSAEEVAADDEYFRKLNGE